MKVYTTKITYTIYHESEFEAESKEQAESDSITFIKQLTNNKAYNIEVAILKEEDL